MKRSQHTEGAMMIVTVLIVMVTLVVVLAVTAQLTLSSRRSTVAQDATAKASYAAESGIARAQAQLNVVNELLQTNHISIPVTTSTSQVQTDIYNMCGGTVQALSATNTVLCASKNATDLTKGIFDGMTAAQLQNSTRLDFLVKYIPVSAFSAAGITVSDTTAARAFWAQMFGSSGKTLKGGNDSSAYSSSVRLVLSQVTQTGTDEYNLSVLVPDVTALGNPETGSVRKLVMGPNTVTPYVLTVARSSFAKYALFTNRHYSTSGDESGCSSSPSNCNRITFTSNTLFSGPVHTNSQFNFQGTPYFGGTVTSAGCPAGRIATDSSGNDYCSSSAVPGAYFFSTNWVAQSSMSPNDQAPTKTVCTSTYRNGTCATTTTSNPQFLGGVNWRNDFIPLPKNANNQATQAAGDGVTGGISVTTGTVSNMTLAATEVKLGTASTTTKVQRITYTVQTTANKVTTNTTTDLAVDANNNVYINVSGTWVLATQDKGTGTWAAAATGVTASNAAKFNGVIYAKGGVSSLNGPLRTTASNPATAAAAVASFSRLTLASDDDINITSDLKYADPPCSGSNSVTGGTFTAATCTNRSAKNILGIYSSAGDVNIISPSSSNKPCTTASTLMPSCAVGNDVNIHAVLMASQGRVTVDGYDKGTADNSLGKVHLMGGIIENYYGAFGVTSGTGFGRDFVYDARTSEGLTPPSFPTQQEWSANLDRPMKLDQAGYQIQRGQ